MQLQPPYITTEEVEAVKNGFAAYLAANGKAALNVRYLIGSEMNNDGLTNLCSMTVRLMLLSVEIKWITTRIPLSLTTNTAKRRFGGNV